MTAPAKGERVSVHADGQRTTGTVRAVIADRILVIDVGGRRVRRVW